MRPIYNSVRITNHRDIKSVDRDPIYAQVLPNGTTTNGTATSYNNFNGGRYTKQNQMSSATTSVATRNHVMMGLGGVKMPTHKHRQSLLNVPFVDRNTARDIRSCERDYSADLSTATSIANTITTPAVIKAPKSKLRHFASSVSSTIAETMPNGNLKLFNF